jgi:hypothetical protein
MIKCPLCNELVRNGEDSVEYENPVKEDSNINFYCVKKGILNSHYYRQIDQKEEYYVYNFTLPNINMRWSEESKTLLTWFSHKDFINGTSKIYEMSLEEATTLAKRYYDLKGFS